MGLFKRTNVHTDITTSPTTLPCHTDPDKADITFQETASTSPSTTKWKLNKAGDGDAAMALFNSPTELHEPIDPSEEKALVRKIDLMVLPYLAVCYAFFYIDKTTLR